MYHVSCINIKQFKILFKTQCTVVKKLENTRVVEMNKKQLKIALAVLNAVKSRFPETQEFFENTLREECEGEKMTADEVIFCKFRSKKKIRLDKHFRFRYGTKVIIFFVYRCGKVWQIVKRRNVY